MSERSGDISHVKSTVMIDQPYGYEIYKTLDILKLLIFWIEP